MGIDLVPAPGDRRVSGVVPEERISSRLIGLSGRTAFYHIIVSGRFRVLRSSSFDIRPSSIGIGVGPATTMVRRKKERVAAGYGICLSGRDGAILHGCPIQSVIALQPSTVHMGGVGKYSSTFRGTPRSTSAFDEFFPPAVCG